MAAFLGLCEAGHIGGIKGGLEYIGDGNVFARNQLLSKPYVQHSIMWACAAVDLLNKDSELAGAVVTDTENAKGKLYNRLGITNTSNSQMDVVMALWINGLFATQC